MAPTKILLPESSSKSLIPQDQLLSSFTASPLPSPSSGSSSSSSSSSSSTITPNAEQRSLPESSGSEHPSNAPPSDIPVRSSCSSSSFALPRDAQTVSPLPKHRKKKKAMKLMRLMTSPSPDKDNRDDVAGDVISDIRSSKRLSRPRSSSSMTQSSKTMSGQSLPDTKQKRKRHSMCCKCAAGFTADCAAVCCCPLALLHLAALTFIRLPTAVAWKMMVNLRKKLCVKKPPKNEEDDSPRTWSCAGSPEVMKLDNQTLIRFDSENLLQHFEADRLDFGGFSHRPDSP